MITFVLKNLLRNKRRSILTLIGVIIGVAGIVSLVSISFGMAKNISEVMESFNGIFIMQAGSVDEQFSRIDTTEYVAELQNLNGIKYVLPEIYTTGNIKIRDFLSPVLFIIGIDPELSADYEGAVYYTVTNGRKLRSTDKDSIIISETLRERANLQIGSSLKISDKNYRVIGTFESDSLIFNLMAVTALDEARTLANIEEDYVTNIQAVPSNPQNQNNLKDTINLRFKGELEAMNMQESSELINGIIGNIRIALWAISAIAGIVGGIVVTNTMLMSVMERIQEFGVLKSIGWQNNHIRNMILMESIILSLIGGAIGILLGIAISEIAQNYIRVPTLVTFELMMQALLFATVMGIIGGLYPANKAMKMSPVEALR
jgi:putative ABC transport system permease protein